MITALPNDKIFASDSQPYGIPYSEWIEKWWTWWTGIPNDKHPAKDYSDSERCSIMQNGPVWFLPDIVPGKGHIKYSCTVPIGKSILLPITTTFCERADKGGGGSCGNNLTDNELKIAANNIKTPLKNMKILIDGELIPISGSPIVTDFFNITFPDNPIDIWGKVNPGTYKTIATGYFLFLKDLSPGKHEIELTVVDLLKGNEGPPPIFDPKRKASFEIVIQ